MKTTIQVSKDLVKELKKRKIDSRDSYEGVIWDLLEETMELSEETKKSIEKARKQIKRDNIRHLKRLRKNWV